MRAKINRFSDEYFERELNIFDIRINIFLKFWALKIAWISTLFSNDTLSASGNDTGADFNETEKKQPVIATFDEWTKQKLNKKEQLNKQPTNSNAVRFTI